MNVTDQQYQAVCDVIDRARLDESPEDTDGYATAVLHALGLLAPWERQGEE